MNTPSLRVDLSSSHITRLSAALEDACSSVDLLRQMLRQDLDGDLSLPLESVVPTANRTLPAICQDLVLWALRDHRVGLQGLLAAALRTNPTNPQLLALQQEWDGITFTAPACPYPGMKAFTAQWGHFYGRDEDIAAAVNRLRYYPFLAIIGPSGSGKSSLLHAGILPALAQSHHFADKCWDVRNMRPGATPYATLLALLDMPIAQQNSQPAFEPSIRPDTRLLMLVDQYEELYTTADVDQRKLFEQALLYLLTVLEVHLVITARADFYANLMASPLWSQISNHRLEVTPLRGNALRQAVERPARDVGVLLEPALVERLLADAGDDQPGILPFMQETLHQLWERADEASVGLAAYTALVAGKSGRSGLQVALDLHADRVYWDKLADDEERTVTRRIMLRLVQFSGDSTVTRRQMTVDDLRKGAGDNATFDRVLTTLTHNRLLTLSDEARRVDLSHEAMIHGWSRLSHWVNERRLAFQTRRRLEEKATERQRLLANNGNGGLLDPVALAEAQAWVKSADAADVGVSDGLEVLVADSHEAIQRSVAHLRRRNQVLVAVASVAIVAMAVAVLFFFNAQREAQNARNAEIVAQANANQALQQQATAEANAIEADKQRAAALAAQATAEANRSEVERAARRLQAESLAANAQLLMQRDHVFGDRTMLLALDAVRATLTTDGYVTSNADAALRAALGGPNWRMTLGAGSAGVEGKEYAVAYSPDGTLLAGGSSDGAVRVWDAKTGDLRALLEGHGEAATAVAFSPNGYTLASSGSDGIVRLWNAQTWAPTKLLEGHGGTVNAVAFSPDGRVLASGSDDGSVRLWDVDSGQTLHILEGHQGEVTAVAFSPDGVMLASGNAIEGASQGDDAPYNVQLWDPTTGESIRTLIGHVWGITSLAFSPTGSILASSSKDKTVRLWDVETGQTTKTLEGYDTEVNSVTFLPYHYMLITGNGDGTVRYVSRAVRQKSAENQGKDEGKNVPARTLTTAME